MATSKLGRHGALSPRAERCRGVYRVGLSAALCYSLHEPRRCSSWFRPEIFRRAVPPFAGWVVGRDSVEPRSSLHLSGSTESRPYLLRRRDDERGAAGLPLVAEAKGQRRWRGGGIFFRELGLRVFQETLYRAGVTSMKADVPFVLGEEAKRNSRVILEDNFAVSQKVAAHFRKVIRVHEVGSRFEQGQAMALLLAELAEVRINLDRPVSQVGREIIQRLRPSR